MNCTLQQVVTWGCVKAIPPEPFPDSQWIYSIWHVVVLFLCFPFAGLHVGQFLTVCVFIYYNLLLIYRVDNHFMWTLFMSLQPEPSFIPIGTLSVGAQLQLTGCLGYSALGSAPPVSTGHNWTPREEGLSMIRVTPEDKLTSRRASDNRPRRLSLTTSAYGSITQAIRFTRPRPEVQSEVKNAGGSEQWTPVTDAVAYRDAYQPLDYCLLSHVTDQLWSCMRSNTFALSFSARVIHRDHTGIDLPSRPRAGPTS